MEVRAGRLVQRFYHEVWNEADETVAREILHADLRFKEFRPAGFDTRTGLVRHARWHR